MLDGFQTEPFRRGGPAGIFSFDADGAADVLVLMTVHHRDDDNPEWCEAGCLSAFASTRSSLKLTDLKQELRLRFSIRSGHGGAKVRVRPPEWLP